ncbi:MAG: alpha/beta hydrolase [Burkholderiales bacterium]|nr:alpha/beta hydrolase [Burkholderiales bacterium]
MDASSESGLEQKLEILEACPRGGGKGRPLLFVHGAFAGAWCWSKHFLPYFSKKGFRACALSLSGHGGSPGRERLDWLSIADYVRDLEQAVDIVGGDPVIVGHSMGGFVLQKYLEGASAPAAVLMASVPPQGLLSSSIALAFSNPGLFTDLNSMMHRGRASIETLQHALFATPVAPEELKAYYHLMQPESQRAMWDMTFFDLPRLQRERCPPMLVLGAELDILVPPSQVEQAAQAYGTEAVVFPGMGHVMMLEAGWQDVADRMIGWLRGLKLEPAQAAR